MAKKDFRAWANSKVKRLEWDDLALLKFSCIAFGVLLTMLVPSLLTVNIWLVLAAVVLLAIKPAYKAYGK